jgi:hypothetical protein
MMLQKIYRCTQMNAISEESGEELEYHHASVKQWMNVRR